MNDKICSDILIEALEVFINHILYVRQVYPPEIFRKRKIYNCPVYVSVYANVTNYITQTLITAQKLKQDKKLKKVELIICRDENWTYEKYSFDISDDCALADAKKDEDAYLLDFEQQLRTSLYQLSERCKNFEKIPDDARFIIELHTTQSAFMETCCGPTNEAFPWLQVHDNIESNFREVTILPLCTVNTTGLKINALV